MKNFRKGFIVPLIILIIAVLVGSGSYVAYKTNKAQKAAQSVQTSTKDQKNKKPVTDTSDWKTYTNSQYGFSFRYPQDWKIMNLKNENGGPVVAVAPNSYEPHTSDSYYGYFIVNRFDNLSDAEKKYELNIYMNESWEKVGVGYLRHVITDDQKFKLSLLKGKDNGISDKILSSFKD